MRWLTRWARGDHSRRQRVVALLAGQVLFWVGFPSFIVVGSTYIDRWWNLARYGGGLGNTALGLLLIVPGAILAEWAVQVQYAIGRGSPMPIVATRRLVKQGPYRHSRNPMALGTTMVYMGLAACIGSFSALALASIYPTFILVYTKLIEERELEERFGSEYLEYKRRTPFLVPGWRRRH